MFAPVVVQNSGGGGLNGILKQASPDERAAILKARFAETIAKVNGGKSSAKERKILERKRRLGEAKIKALKRKVEIKREGELKRKREEGELKRKREEEREAARKALEMVERNSVVEDNFVTRELESLIGGGGSVWSDLGLYLEEEDDDDEYNGGCKKTKN